MADLARLVFEIDASQAVAAKRKLEELGASALNLDRAADKVSRSGNKMSDSVGKATNSFGLAGYQVRNFGQQITDLVVQIGSGGGLFRPLLQQGPQVVDSLGGMSASAGVLRTALSAIGPVGIASFGAVATAAAAAFKILGADGVRREVETLTEQFRNLQKSFGSGTGASAAEAQMQGILDAARRTGVEMQVLAAAQRDLMKGGLEGGLGFGVTAESTAAVEKMVTSLQRLGTETDATNEITKRFFADIARGALDQKTFNLMLEQSPRFARAFAASLGGVPRVLSDLNKGAVITGRQMLTAFRGAQGPIEQMSKTYVPSLGQAFDIMKGKASAASTEISLAFGKKTQGFADGITTKLLELGQWFETLPAKMGLLGAAIMNIGAQLDSLGVRMFAVLEQFDAFTNFKSPEAMFAATMAEIEGIRAKTVEWLGKIDEVNARLGITTDLAKGLQGLTDPPTFLANTIKELEKIIGLIEAVTGFAGKVGSYFGSNAGAAQNMRDAGMGPLVQNPGDRGEQKIADELQKMRSSVEDGTKATESGAQAAAQTPEAVKSMGSMVAGEVQNGVTVWSSGQSASTNAIERNTASTRDGLRSLENTTRQVGESMAEMLARGVTSGFSFTDGAGFQHAETTIENALWQKRVEEKFRAATDGGMTFFMDRPADLRTGGHMSGGNGGKLLTAGKMAAPRSSEEFAEMKAAALGESQSAVDAINRTLLKVASPALGAVNDNGGMTSAPTPDPYRDRNPDYFYNNTTGQVTKAKTEAEVLRNLPKDIAKEIADALVKAGIVGEKIGEAIVQAGTRPSAAPTPQDGWLPNRGPIRGNYGPSIYNRTAMR